MRDLQEDVAERQQFFADAGAEGNEDLMDELDELEALNVEEEMQAMNVGTGHIAQQNPVAPV